MELPKVSVVTITYGHEKYITETLDGVLMQEYDGPVEFIIANDNSPDATDEVVKKFFLENPVPGNFEIKYTKHETNKGMMPNFIWALQQAKGKYIALCEGDDYWTDPLKLQKQVDFLEENEDYTAITHNSNIIGIEQRVFSKREAGRLKTNDLIKDRLFHTNCILFRRNNELMHFLANTAPVLSGDRQLFLAMSKFGNIYYDKEIMAIYRKNENGISRNVTYKQLRKDLNIITNLNKLQLEYNEAALFNFIHYTLSAYSTKPLTFFQKTDHLLIKFQYNLLNKNFNLKSLLKRVING